MPVEHKDVKSEEKSESVNTSQDTSLCMTSLKLDNSTNAGIINTDEEGYFHPFTPESMRNNTTSGSESTPLISRYSEGGEGRASWSGCSFLSSRHTLAFLAFLGFINVYLLRVNLSVALVAMVNSTTSSDTGGSEECRDLHENSTLPQTAAEFDWNENLQGIVLGSFFYGYIITQIPGGWLASKIGGKSLFGYGVLCTAALTLLTPIAARISVYLLIVVRVLEGIGEGVTFPAMHAMWGSWAPKLERSKLVSFSYAGGQLGTVLSLPISGYLCASDIAGGWPSVFYTFGAMGCAWFVVWMLMAHNTPADHPRISREEQEYIEESVGIKENLRTPWREMLSSPAVLSLCVAHFSNNWGFYTLLTCLPSYMKNILKFNMTQNGLLSALPYLAQWIILILSGIAADFLRGNNGYLTTKSTRKWFNFAGLVLPGLFVVFVGYVGCDHVLAVVFLTLSVGLSGVCMGGGFYVNHLDIAPRFAGSLMGITNCVATIPGFLGPAVVGYLTNKNNTRHQWQIVFYISAGVSLLGAIIYLLFGEGEELPWAKGHNNKLDEIYSASDEEWKRLSVEADARAPTTNGYDTPK